MGIASCSFMKLCDKVDKVCFNIPPLFDRPPHIDEPQVKFINNIVLYVFLVPYATEVTIIVHS